MAAGSETEGETGAAGDGLSITPPFGYTQLHPLQKTDRVLIPHGATPDFCRSVNAIALSWSEFVPAAREYPIVFAGGAGDAYAPVVVLGLADAQNLYVGEQGEWDRSSYVPAFVRRYPFCIARITVEGKERADRMVCVEKSYVDKQGIALYDDQGKPTPQWQGYETLLQEYETDLDLTTQMCSILAKLEIFSPFQFQVLQGKDPAFTMQGMFRIDEKKLADLKPLDHKALVTRGLMAKIYAHIHSLENFGRLYARAVTRAEMEEKRKKEGFQR
jgi:hypothetical protein